MALTLKKGLVNAVRLVSHATTVVAAMIATYPLRTCWDCAYSRASFLGTEVIAVGGLQRELTLVCRVDDEPVAFRGGCGAWQARPPMHPESAHEKAALLALKAKTYTERHRDYV